MSELKEQDLRNQINAALWYALGDIEPTDPKMERALNAAMIFVDEAFSRGKVEGLEEARDRIQHMLLWSKGNVEGTRNDIVAKLEKLIQEAKK